VVTENPVVLDRLAPACHEHQQDKAEQFEQSHNRLQGPATHTQRPRPSQQSITGLTADLISCEPSHTKNGVSLAAHRRHFFSALWDCASAIRSSRRPERHGFDSCCLVASQTTADSVW